MSARSSFRTRDEAWAYSKEREAFGRPIGQFLGVIFPLAEGDSQIAAVRQLCYHALALRDADLPHTAEAAMCNWMGPRNAFDVIHQCLLTFGCGPKERPRRLAGPAGPFARRRRGWIARRNG